MEGNRIHSVTSWVSPYVRQFLSEKNKNNDRDYSYFHPSEIGGCPRKIALKMLGMEETNPDTIEDILKFDTGHGVHHRWLTYFRDCGLLSTDKIINIYKRESNITKKNKNRIVLCGESGREYPYKTNEYIWVKNKCKEPNTFTHVDSIQLEDEIYLAEVPFEYEDWRMSGNTDGILKIDGEEYIVDLKSINDKGFWFLFHNEGSNEKPKYDRCHICGDKISGFGSNLSKHLNKQHVSFAEPHKDHIIQMNSYMQFLSVNQTIVVYENKNNHEVVETYIAKDAHVIESIGNLCKNLYEMVKQNQIPQIPSWAAPRDCFACTFCNYYNYCWPNSQGGWKKPII